MDKMFMTFAEAIEFLRLSRQTINRLIARKEIPNYKVGKRRLFDRDELIDWVKSHRNGPVLKEERKPHKAKGKRK